MNLAVSEADLVQADSLEQELYGDLLPPVWHAAVAAGRDDQARFERLLAEHAAEVPELPMWGTYSSYVAFAADREDAARRIAGVDTLPHRPAATRAPARFILAEMAAARGDWEEARRHLTAAARDDPLSARVVRGMIAALPFLDVPSADLGEVRSDLRAWDAAVAPAEGVTEMMARALPPLRLHLLGLVSAKAGEHDEALAWADSIDDLVVPDRLERTARSLAATVRAQVADDRGAPAEALAHLVEVTGAVPLELLKLYTRLPGNEYLYPFAEDHARYLRALALRGVGEDDEALRWLRNGYSLTPGEIIYGDAAERVIAEIEAGRVPHR